VRERRADKLRQIGDGVGFGAAQPSSEVNPESDAELGAGFGEAAISSAIAAGAAADLALDDLSAQVALRTVGVQRDVGPIENRVPT